MERLMLNIYSLDKCGVLIFFYWVKTDRRGWKEEYASDRKKYSYKEIQLLPSVWKLMKFWTFSYGHFGFFSSLKNGNSMRPSKYTMTSILQM